MSYETLSRTIDSSVSDQSKAINNAIKELDAELINIPKDRSPFIHNFWPSNRQFIRNYNGNEYLIKHDSKFIEVSINY